MSNDDEVGKAAERVLQLEAELESSGDAIIEADALASARATLHQWVDGIVGVVASPGVGRVTLIHRDGYESKIACPSLPFLLSKPASFES